MNHSSGEPKIATAYGFLTTNLLVLPGVGTYLAGKKISGVVQIIIALIGITASIYGLYEVIHGFLKYKSNPIMVFHEAGLWIMAAGCMIFFAGWIWSFVSGYSLIKEARREVEPPKK